MALPLRRTWALVLALIAVSALGCGNRDAIESYKVARASDRGENAQSAGYRILGALYPADNPVWYFKFAGASEPIAKHEAEFDKLAASVKLQADPSAVPAFELPAGWTKTGKRIRAGFTTDEVLKLGPPNAPLEVTITNIPGGGLVQNLGRWAGQVDADFDPNNAAAAAKPFDAVGGKGLRVDFRGPKNPAGGGPMMKPR